MNIADLLLIIGIGVFAWSGWRQGFVIASASFIGFIGGGIAGAFLAPKVLEGSGLAGPSGLLITIVTVLGLAIAGQAVASMLGRSISEKVTWKPARIIDQLGGAVLNVAALVIIAWVLAATALALPSSQVATAVRTSTLFANIDRAVPSSAKELVTGLRAVIDNSGLPRLFDSLGALTPSQIEAPATAIVSDPEVQRALNSVIKVAGDAPSCHEAFTGSGFVIGPQRVLTNAHVVAGVEKLRIQVPGMKEELVAQVVYFDPRIDVAILAVPNLKAKSLDLAAAAQRGTDAVIAGYPGGGPMVATAARVRGTIAAEVAVGTDIYGRPGVPREIYALRGTARPGNSGGPLLSLDGQVLGVVFAQAENDPDTAYALTADQIAPAVQAGQRASAAVSTGSCAA